MNWQQHVQEEERIEQAILRVTYMNKYKKYRLFRLNMLCLLPVQKNSTRPLPCELFNWADLLIRGETWFVQLWEKPSYLQTD